MSVQLFRLKNVPDDEAEEIRSLLEKNYIDYFETPAGSWGISMPAIWLNDEDQLEKAMQLIDSYQSERLARYRSEPADRKNILSELFNNPVQFVAYIAFEAVILYFSIKPFLNFGQ